MLDGRSILALIPARGGSRGIAGKNLRQVAGRSLLAWTAKAAAESRYIDRVMLSSDDDAIMQAARDLGVEVPFRRPAELATDTAGAVGVAVHALEALEPSFDVLVLLQPTSPLRTGEDIDRCLELLASRNADSCTSVHECSKPPEWMFRVADDGRMQPVLPAFDDSRRQDIRPTHVLNGAVYACRVAAFLAHRRFVTADTLAYVMPRERGLDIDEELDLVVAEALLARR